MVHFNGKGTLTLSVYAWNVGFIREIATASYEGILFLGVGIFSFLILEEPFLEATSIY